MSRPLQFEEKVITYKDRIVFIKLSMPFFNRTLKQYAEDEACFMFVNKGEVGVRTPENYLKLNKEMAMIAKCLNYFFEPTGNKESRGDGIESVGVFLYPSLIEDLFELDVTQSNYTVDYNVKQVQVDMLLENYKESINILLENPELVDEAIIRTKLKEFVHLIAKSQNAPTQLDFLSALFKPNNIKLKSMIQQNLYVNLSVEELASLAHLSVSTFKRKFKEAFGESPKKYITRKKVQRAAKLLRSGKERVSNIAYDVGFESVATFNRNFTSEYGQAPSDYRLS